MSCTAIQCKTIMSTKVMQVMYTNKSAQVEESGGYINWGFKSPKLNIYSQTVSRIPCRYFVFCKVASKTNHFHS